MSPPTAPASPNRVLQTLWVTLRIKRRWCQNGWRSMLLQPSRPCRWSLPTILTRPKALGITIPETMLATADEVIQ